MYYPKKLNLSSAKKMGATTSALFPFALSSQITTFALYVICSIRQLIYDITRHLLHKHFYDCNGPIALLNICSMSKHVICSKNIFYKYLIILKLYFYDFSFYNSSNSFIIPPTSWRQFCLSGICAYCETKLNINISLFFDTLFVQSRINIVFTTYYVFLPLLLLSSLAVMMEFEEVMKTAICEFYKKNSRISQSSYAQEFQ